MVTGMPARSSGVGFPVNGGRGGYFGIQAGRGLIVVSSGPADSTGTPATSSVRVFCGLSDEPFGSVMILPPEGKLATAGSQFRHRWRRVRKRSRLAQEICRF